MGLVEAHSSGSCEISSSNSQTFVSSRERLGEKIQAIRLFLSFTFIEIYFIPAHVLGTGSRIRIKTIKTKKNSPINGSNSLIRRMYSK